MTQESLALLTPGPRDPPAISLGCKARRADPCRPPGSHSAPCLPCTALPRDQRVTQGLGCTRRGRVSIRLPLGSPRKTTCLKGHEVIELLRAGRQLLVRGGCDTAQRAVRICGREETVQRQPQAPPRCHRDGHTGRARVGPAWPWEVWAGGYRQCGPWSLGFVPALGGPNGKRVLPHRVAVL